MDITPRKLILHCPLSPGDVLTLTAAVESLHAAYPGEFTTDVRTTAKELWDYNPRITRLSDHDRDALSIHVAYPQIKFSSFRAVNFLACYAEFLGKCIRREIPLATNRPHVYLTEEECAIERLPPQLVQGGDKRRYGLIVSGTKPDFTAKQWPVEHYQAVVDQTRQWLTWVQIGRADHDHPPLRGVLNLVGRTSHRELARLAFHSQLGLGPVTFLLHLCAAFERPYVYIAGGREPLTWISYPYLHVLHSMKTLPCNQHPCWKCRTLETGDGDSKDNSLCERPRSDFLIPSPECMAMISPERAVQALEMYR